MKKFDFKLKGLHKIRQFEEQKIKIELGEIVKEIQNLLDENDSISSAIDLAYQSQEQMLRKDTEGRNVRFYPYYIAGRNAHIEYNKNKIYALRKKYEEKVEQMKKAMGDVKIIDNLKEKQFTKFRKKLEKKEQEDLEELFLMNKSRMSA